MIILKILGIAAIVVAALFVLTFVVYYNLMSIGQSWVASGRMSLLTYMLGIHGGLLAIAVFGLTLRHKRWRFKDLFQRRGVAA